jgi:hypothetical protein
VVVLEIVGAGFRHGVISVRREPPSATRLSGPPHTIRTPRCGLGATTPRTIPDAGCGPRITTHTRKAGQSITRKYNAFGAKEGSGRHSAGHKGHDSSTTPPTVIADAPNRVWAVDFQVDVTTDGWPITIVSKVDEHDP